MNFPSLCISSNSIEYICHDFDSLTLAGYYSWFDSNPDFYTANGKFHVTNIKSEFTDSLFKRTLNKICWNPFIDVKFEYSSPEKYELQDLLRKIENLILLDDDVLTQENSKESIISALKNISSYNELISALIKLNVIEKCE